MGDGRAVTPLLLYASVLIVYLPGVVGVLASQKSLKYPVISFFFLGMFFFNVLGSIGVFWPEKKYIIFFDTEAVAENVALVLIIQGLIFYIVALPYVLIRRSPSLFARPAKLDFLIIGCGIIGMAILVACYFFETKNFLFFNLIDGSMGLDNSFEFRMKYIYGLNNWPIYNIGFTFLPAAISIYAVITYTLGDTCRWIGVLAIVMCIAISMMLGSKAGFVGFAIPLALAYGVIIGYRDGRLSQLLISKKLFGFFLASVFFLYIGYNKASGGALGLVDLVERVLYRVFVVGPETIAAVISFVQENGELGLSVFPSARGLLSHEQINLSLIIHEYMAGAEGGATLPFSAEAFISAKWGGVMAISAFVSLILIFLQEVAFRIKVGVASLAFSALISYLAVRMTTIGVFATFLNFMYPATILTIALFIACMTVPMRWSNGVNLIGEGRRSATEN